MDKLPDRMRGALLGLAVGDALGAPAEFMPRGRFEPVTGMRAGGKFELAAGEWTDDTAQALCLAESLIACQGINLQDQMQRYLDWFLNGYMSCSGRAVGVGQQTLRALLDFQRTGKVNTEVETARTKPDGRKRRRDGNGCLMRLAPVAIFYVDSPDLAEAAAASAIPTHPSPLCQETCSVFAQLIAGAFRTEHKSDIFALAHELAGKVDSVDLREVLCKAGGDRPAEQIASTGYVLDTLDAALWAFNAGGSFAEGALLAVNLGDDADTVGAVYGQLAGAFYGAQAIPGEWLQVLARKAEIVDIATRLIESKPIWTEYKNR